MKDNYTDFDIEPIGLKCTLDTNNDLAVVGNMIGDMVLFSLLKNRVSFIKKTRMYEVPEICSFLSFSYI